MTVDLNLCGMGHIFLSLANFYSFQDTSQMYSLSKALDLHPKHRFHNTTLTIWYCNMSTSLFLMGCDIFDGKD